jgi:hypothetical protein
VGGFKQRERPGSRLGDTEQARALAPLGSGKAPPLGSTVQPDVGQIRALQSTAGNAVVARAIAGRNAQRSAQVERLQRHASDTAAISRLQGAGGSRSTVQRLKFKAASPKVEQAKDDLKASIGGKNAKNCGEKLGKRFPRGPLFTDADIGSILTLSNNPEGAAWLDEVGIGGYSAANSYLMAKDYKDWLKRKPGQRLLMATLAWKGKVGKDDPNPPPSYTLGRAMAIESGLLTATEQQQAEKARDKTIRDAFVNTLMPLGTAEEANVRAGRTRQEGDDIVDHNAAAQRILTKILLILHEGLQIYDKGQGQHVDFKQGDVVRALAHGGRVNIRIAALRTGESAYDLTDWIGITGTTSSPVKSRGFGTHHMDIGENKKGQPGSGHFKETGGKSASLANKTSKGVKLWGLDLAAGGLGQTDFNGDVILPDGGHGHMFIGLTKPTKKKDGALQIGIETTGPGAPSLVGYEHTWQSTEATANPESSFYGHKMQKVGGGKLEGNQRLVDLNRLERTGQTWLQWLQIIEGDWLGYTQVVSDPRTAYEALAGPRA